MTVFFHLMRFLSKSRFNWIDLLLIVAVAPLWNESTWAWALALICIGALVSDWCEKATARLTGRL